MTRLLYMYLLVAGWIFLLVSTPFSVRADGEPYAAEFSNDKECVILLHGLGRTYRAMEDMARALRREGFTVANVDYPSTDFMAEELADIALPQGIAECRAQGSTTIHIITHSLGGVLTRYYLKNRQIADLGRVVMLSPPNSGSEIPETFSDTWLFNAVMGPVFPQLRSSEDSFVNSLGPVSFPLGIITGNKSLFFDRYFSTIIPGEDDGKVSVERAKVEGMTDFIVLPYTHPYIMEEDEVIEQAIYFLRNGLFDHKE